MFSVILKRVTKHSLSEGLCHHKTPKIVEQKRERQIPLFPYGIRKGDYSLLDIRDCSCSDVIRRTADLLLELPLISLWHSILGTSTDYCTVTIHG
jgi:hypothetical protein